MKKFNRIILCGLLASSLILIILISILSNNNFYNNITTTSLVAIADISDDLNAAVDTFITESSEATENTITTVTSAVNIVKTKITTDKVTTTNSTVNLVKKDGNVSNKFVTNANKQISKLPDKFVDSLEENGWSIYVTDKDLAKTFFDGKYSSVRACTVYSVKTIYIEDRDVAVNNSTIHEIGHYVDYTSGWVSKTSEFKKIYEEEVDTFKSRIDNSSSIRDEQEFFAAMFCYYYKDSSKCTPKAKAYIENIIENF